MIGRSRKAYYRKILQWFGDHDGSFQVHYNSDDQALVFILDMVWEDHKHVWSHNVDIKDLMFRGCDIPPVVEKIERIVEEFDPQALSDMAFDTN